MTAYKIYICVVDDSTRPPLYQPPAPRRDSFGEELKAANAQKKKKHSLTSTDLKSRPVTSAKVNTL